MPRPTTLIRKIYHVLKDIPNCKKLLEKSYEQSCMAMSRNENFIFSKCLNHDFYKNKLHLFPKLSCCKDEAIQEQMEMEEVQKDLFFMSFFLQNTSESSILSISEKHKIARIVSPYFSCAYHFTQSFVEALQNIYETLSEEKNFISKIPPKVRLLSFFVISREMMVRSIPPFLAFIRRLISFWRQQHQSLLSFPYVTEWGTICICSSNQSTFFHKTDAFCAAYRLLIHYDKNIYFFLSSKFLLQHFLFKQEIDKCIFIIKQRNTWEQIIETEEEILLCHPMLSHPSHYVTISNKKSHQEHNDKKMKWSHIVSSSSSIPFFFRL